MITVTSKGSILKEIELGAERYKFAVRVLPGLQRVNFRASGPFALTKDQAGEVQAALGWPIPGYGAPVRLAASQAQVLALIDTEWQCAGSCD